MSFMESLRKEYKPIKLLKYQLKILKKAAY